MEDTKLNKPTIDDIASEVRQLAGRFDVLNDNLTLLFKKVDFVSEQLSHWREQSHRCLAKSPDIPHDKSCSCNVDTVSEQDACNIVTPDPDRKTMTSGCERTYHVPDDCILRVQHKHQKRRYITHISDDQRQECLRRAIQENLTQFVENLPFSDSELADYLISAECLTEDECSDLRKYHNKRDQVRNLIRIIRGRSYKVLHSFLQCVSKLSKELSNEVWASYSQKLLEANRKRVCTFCKLKETGQIKTIADSLWERCQLSDDVYDEIVMSPSTTYQHWEKLSQQCCDVEHPRRSLETVVQALQKRGHYESLVQKLRNETSLVCRCGDTMHGQVSWRHPVEDTEESTETYSPRSSLVSEEPHCTSLTSVDEETMCTLLTVDVMVDKSENLLLPGRELLEEYEVDILRIRRSNSVGKHPGHRQVRHLSNRRASMFS